MVFSYSSRLKWTQTANDAVGIGSLVMGAILTICNILLFVGAYKRQRGFFLPWLIIEMIGIVLAYIAAGFFLVVGNSFLSTTKAQAAWQLVESLKLPRVTTKSVKAAHTRIKD